MSDQPARDRAIHNHTTTFLVEAGAGTGKTTLLVDRICELLERGALAEEIAAVTFTIKAAGELKDRLRKKLRTETSAAAAQALRDLDRMSVSTIHSLATDLLRTLPVEAGLPPEFAVLDELQDKRMLNEYFTDWLTRALDRPVPTLVALADNLGIDVSKDSKKGISALFNTLRKTGGDSRHVGTGGATTEDLTTALDAIARHVQAAQDLLAHCSDETDFLGAALRKLATWRAQQPPDVQSAAGVAWLSFVPPSLGNKGKKEHWSSLEVRDAARAMFPQLQELIADARAALFSLACDACVKWLAPAVAEYRGILRKTGQIGFDDLLVCCRDMLRDSPVARRHFKQRFRYLHIDEFQDTDPVQVELLFYLAEADTAHESEWQRVQLQPGKLFLVGDPKQSIYRFRGADVHVYHQVADLIRDCGEVLSITRNFRSRAEIINEVNAIFGQLMRAATDETPAYQPLETTRTEAHAAPAVELLAPQDDYNAAAMTADTAARAEAEALADHLLGAKHSGSLASYSDAAIIMRASTKLAILQEALSARDIPFVSFLNAAFVSRVEVECVYTMLAALANPQHTVATIGALRSSWFAVSDEELFAHKYAGRTFVYTDPQPRDTIVGRALQRLADWRQLSARLRCSELLELMLEETPLDVLFGVKSEGVQRVQNLFAIVELIRKLEAGGEFGLQTIVERFGELQKVEQNTELEARDSARDAVQLLTLHKAKGLEFKTVYLFHLREQEQTGQEWLLRKGTQRTEHQLGVSIGSGVGKWQTVNYSALSEVESAAALAEEQRLHYVGMTRARERLIMTAGFAHKKELKNLAFLPTVIRCRYFRDGEQAFSSDGTAARVTIAAPSKETSFHPYRSVLKSPPFAAFSAIPEEWKRWHAERNARVAELRQATSKAIEVESEVDWQRVRAQRVGSAVHLVLEKLARNLPLEQALAFADAKLLLDPHERAEVGELAQVVLASDLFTKDLSRAVRIFTELPITEAQPDQVRSHYVDLVWQDANGDWHIVDYKTDQAKPADVHTLIGTKYGAQLRDYAALLARVTGRTPASVRLFFIRAGTLVAL